MNARRSIYAVVPIKETSDAKGRLAPVLDTRRRQASNKYSRQFLA